MHPDKNSAPGAEDAFKGKLNLVYNILPIA